MSRKMLKSIFSFILIFCCLGIFVPKASAKNLESLIEMSDEECVEYVKQRNITIPTNLMDSDDLGKIIRNIIEVVEENPSYEFTYNYDKMEMFAKQIRDSVLNDFGIHFYAFDDKKYESIYTLKDSLVQSSSGNWGSSGGEWNYRWDNYNCYAYSINRVERPAYYETSKQYQPGDFRGYDAFGLSSSAFELAEYVKQDLEEIGYQNVVVSTTIPQIDSNQGLICVRIASDKSDYHFMRYDLDTNSWYHKPGYTAVLKYKYTPTNDLVWTNEYSYGGEERAGTINYDSKIYFIKYDRNVLNVSYDERKSTTSFIIKAQKDILLELNISNSQNFKFNVNSLSEITYSVYDKNMDLIVELKGKSITDIQNLSMGKNYVRISTESKSNSEISLSVHMHYFSSHYCSVCGDYTEEHDYVTSYSWISTTRHRAYCICGSATTQGHMISQNDVVSGNKYAKCLLCGGNATIGFVFNKTVSLYSKQFSENGSYILPNGIIVLVSKDMKYISQYIYSNN